MSKVATFACIAVALGTLASARPAQGQQELAARVGPRFLVTGATGAPVPVDVSQVALLRARVTVSFDDLPLAAALAAIGKAAGVTVAYSPELLAGSRRIRLRADGLTLAAVLTEVLGDTNLDVLAATTRRIVLIAREPETPVALGAIVGTVTDSASSSLVASALVSIEGTRLSALTGASGKYRIEQVPEGAQVVQVRRIGYARQSRRVTVTGDGEATADFVLKASATPLDEVVVTGTLIPTALKAVPNPMTVITGEDIERLHITKFEDIIRLSVPSAVVTSPYGGLAEPEWVTINLRGATNASGQRLGTGVKIFIDGIETVDASLLSIKPEQIERVEVLRGPEAAALYGSEALGGVVQILTKRGPDGATRPELALQAEVGRIESVFQPGGTLQQLYGANMSGKTGNASYRVGASWRQTGDWLPGYRYRSPSGDAGVRFTTGPVDLDFMTRVSNAVTRPGVNTLFADRFAGSPVESSFISTGLESSNLYTTTTGRVGHRIRPWWRQELLVGMDRTESEGKSYRRRLATPTDTLLTYYTSESQKTSLVYRNTVTVGRVDALQSTWTVGADRYAFSGSSSNTTRALTIEPLVLASGTSVALTRTHYTVTGVYGRGQIGWRDQIFLTGSLRTERRVEQGINGGWPVAGMVGVSLVPISGPTTLKIRGSFGRAIKVPPVRVIAGGFESGGLIQYEANPDIRPEQQRGWDAGIDLQRGSWGSLSLTYYRQAAQDFIYRSRVPPPTTPPYIYRYQNVALVRNQGVELEGQLSAAWVTLRGNFSISTSKPEDLGPIPPSYNLRVGQQMAGYPTRTGGLTVTGEPRRGTAFSVGVVYQGSYSDLDALAYYSCAFLTTAVGCPADVVEDAFYHQMPSAVKLQFSVDQRLTGALTAYISVQDLTNEGNKFTVNSAIGALPGRTSAVGFRATL